MIKHIVLFLLILSCISCNSQEKKRRIVNDFVQDVIMNESFDSTQIEKHLVINPNLNTNKRQKLIDYVNHLVLEFRKSIKRNSSGYEIITLDQLKLDTTIKEYNLRYENQENVFYVISGQEVLFPIILNSDQKIISFFTGLSQGPKSHIPVFLDTFDDF